MVVRLGHGCFIESCSRAGYTNAAKRSIAFSVLSHGLRRAGGSGCRMSPGLRPPSHQLLICRYEGRDLLVVPMEDRWAVTICADPAAYCETVSPELLR